MSEQLIDAIHSDHRETARTAVSSAFPSATLTALQPVAGGASGALAYRIEAGGKPYLMRIEGKRTPFRNPHQYVCMQTAEKAGIAPPLHYLDAEAGVVIMDFLPQRPLTEYPGGSAGLTRDLGRLVARLQSTPVFPELRDYLVVIERLLGYVRGSGMFAPGLLDPHTAGFERIRQAYTWDPATLVSSHNDPNPRNIIFDGKRLWLIDWETAYRNDPLTDIAIIAENFAGTAELQESLLQAWLGRTPDSNLRARLVLMRRLTRLYYAGIILSIFASAPRSTPDADLTAPTPAAFHAAFAEGRLKAGAPETLYTLGKMCLAGFLTGLADPEFEEALTVVQHG